MPWHMRGPLVLAGLSTRSRQGSVMTMMGSNSGGGGGEDGDCTAVTVPVRTLDVLQRQPISRIGTGVSLGPCQITSAAAPMQVDCTFSTGPPGSHRRGSPRGPITDARELIRPPSSLLGRKTALLSTAASLSTGSFSTGCENKSWRSSHNLPRPLG
jgi:hypothetical protein